MNAHGTYVLVEHPEFGSAKGSGLLIDEIVIVHGTILAPLFADCSNDNLVQRYQLLMKQLGNQQQFKNLDDGEMYSKITFKVSVKRLVNSYTIIRPSKTKQLENFGMEEATLCLLFDYTNCSYITEDISQWTFSKTDQEFENNNQSVGPLLLPEFIFLMLGNPEENKFKEILHGCYNCIKNISLYPGQPIVVESTPFGNCSFASSWSRGIISKLVGRDHDGFLTDARLVLGCEGAPIFMFNGKKKTCLIGQVIQTISWCRGEWVGFSLALSIRHLLHTVLQLESTIDYIPFNNLPIDMFPNQIDIGRLLSAVVSVRCRHKSGSGVVINARDGLVLTCSHLVHHAPDSVMVQCEAGQYPAQVVFASPPSTGYDLALLNIGQVPNVTELALANSPPVLGESVLTVGYPLSVLSSPALSAGCVSRVTGGGGPLHTTCVTQSGASGGALVRPPHHLLGLVVANLRLDGATMPSFSFSVSVQDIKEPILRYIKTRDTAHLRCLAADDRVTKMKWSLTDCKL